MFDLEQAIKKWKQELAANPAMEEGYIAELEGHLRDRVEELGGQGVAPEDAFRQVVDAMGRTGEIGGEYYKAHTVRRSGRPPWQPPRFVPALIWNYFKVAARSVRREKLYAFINVTGLSIGMACFILIGLWVKSELSFDRFHAKKDRIFRILNYTKDGQYSSTPTYALAPELKNSYPEVEEFSRVWSWQASLVTRGKRHFQENRIGLADPGFFRMFSFPFVEGNASSALDTKNSVVLTETIARKYFGHEQALGKTLFFNEVQAGFTVSAVIRNIPANSHIQFDLLARVELLGEDRLARWSEWTGPCYILLKPGVSPVRFSEKINGIYRKHIAKDISYFPVLQALTQVNLQQSGRPDHIKRIVLFSLIAVLILILACINFINLLTARSLRRAREIGLRKVVGASRSQIVRQFLGETLLTAVLSMILSLLWVQIMLPGFNRFAGKSLVLFADANRGLIVPIVLLTLATGLLAGCYPALLLSRYKPVQVLKPQLNQGGRGSRLRKILIVFQFAVSVLLVTFTLTVSKQLRYIHSIDLGLNKENIVNMRSNPALIEHFASFANELRNQEGIVSVTAAAKGPTMVGQSFYFSWEGNRNDNALGTDYTVADYDYFKTFSMTIVAGRDFSPRFPADESESCVINETAVKQMGIKNPIGLNLYLAHPAWPENFRLVKVIGVVRDFHARTLHTAIRPFIFRIYRPWHNQIFVKINAKKTAAALQAIERTFRRFVPEYPFEYTFYDEAYQRQYTSELVLGQLLQSFTLLSLFIACLGLFGLTAYTAEQKSREVGIRRVFGATIAGIAWMNITNFLKWVALSHLVAWPLAFYLIRQWLRQFAYPVLIGPGLFALSAALTLVVALLTVGYMAIRAARANPVDSLRYE